MIQYTSPIEQAQFELSFFAKHFLNYEMNEHQLEWLDHYDYCQELNLGSTRRSGRTKFLITLLLWRYTFHSNVKMLYVSGNSRINSIFNSTLMEHTRMLPSGMFDYTTWNKYGIHNEITKNTIHILPVDEFKQMTRRFQVVDTLCIDNIDLFPRDSAANIFSKISISNTTEIIRTY